MPSKYKLVIAKTGQEVPGHDCKNLNEMKAYAKAISGVIVVPLEAPVPEPEVSQTKVQPVAQSMPLAFALVMVLELAEQNALDTISADGDEAQLKEMHKQALAIGTVEKFKDLLTEPSVTSATLSAMLGIPITVSVQHLTKDLDKMPKPEEAPLNKYEQRAIELAKMESMYEDKEFETAGWAAEYAKLRAFFKKDAFNYKVQAAARNATKAMPEGKGKVLAYVQGILGVYETLAKSKNDQAVQVAKAVEGMSEDGIDFNVFK